MQSPSFRHLHHATTDHCSHQIAAATSPRLGCRIGEFLELVVRCTDTTMSCRPSPATALKATIVGNAETAAELVAFLTSEGVAGVGVEGDARDGGDTTLIKYDLRFY